MPCTACRDPARCDRAGLCQEFKAVPPDRRTLVTQDQHSIEGLMALVSEFGQCRWSEGSSGATYIDPLGEKRSREEAADLYKQIESYAAHLQQRPLPVSGEGVLVLLKRPEGYEDVHPELLLQDANINPAFEPEIVSRPLPVREGSITAFELAKAAGTKIAPILRALNAGGGDFTVNQALTLEHIGRALASPSLPVREEPTDEQIDALAMRCCGDLRGDRLCMTRDQRINFARLVLASPSVQNMGEGETGKDGVPEVPRG